MLRNPVDRKVGGIFIEIEILASIFLRSKYLEIRKLNRNFASFFGY